MKSIEQQTLEALQEILALIKQHTEVLEAVRLTFPRDHEVRNGPKPSD